jgi:hypothetical protein
MTKREFVEQYVLANDVRKTVTVLIDEATRAYDHICRAVPEEKVEPLYIGGNTGVPPIMSFNAKDLPMTQTMVNVGGTGTFIPKQEKEKGPRDTLADAL